ncbi:MAG: glycosyltransferase family 4 protein [Halobacteriota archaeon]
MRVLLTSYTEVTEPGGINRAVRELAVELVKRNHDVTVLQPNPAHLPPEELRDGVQIVRVSSRTAPYLYDFSPSFHRYFAKYLRAFNPDVVHVHGNASLVPCEVMHVLRSTSYPVVFSPHYDIFSRATYAGKYLGNIYNRLIGKRLYRVADVVVCASCFEGENVHRLSKTPWDRIVVIPHGISRIDTSKRPERDRDQISLIYFGWLLKLKGVQYILQGLRELRQTFGCRATLTVIGDGPFKPALQRLASELGIDDAVRWYPFVEQTTLSDMVRAADMSLLLSQSENFGIVVVEALALGTPVIVAKTTALVEFLNEPGCFGITYPPESHELARLIMDIKTCDPQVGPLSPHVKTWSAIVEDYERIYKELVN